MKNTCQNHLNKICLNLPERPTGSQGNRLATKYFFDQVSKYGWEMESTKFTAMDWKENGAELEVGNIKMMVYPSPYSTGCDVEAELVAAETLPELIDIECAERVLLLHGDLAQEQLMPKNFVFYNPEEHQQIISTLESKNPKGIICVTSRNAALAGGVYPFPLIEDGDFDIPSVYTTEKNGSKLLPFVGEQVHLVSSTKRIFGDSYNVVARKGHRRGKKIVITAHIDAKKGTPGAIDNATGVVVLLLLAELMRDYSDHLRIELVAFNGEDYYAAPGQMIYLDQIQNDFDDILLNINIDGAGLHEGPSAFSQFDLPPQLSGTLNQVLEKYEGIVEGIPWHQGDHSIFLQQGIPAIAVSSNWFIDHVDNQDITHTPKDHPRIVDCQKIVEIAQAIQDLIKLELVSESK